MRISRKLTYRVVQILSTGILCIVLFLPSILNNVCFPILLSISSLILLLSYIYDVVSCRDNLSPNVILVATFAICSVLLWLIYVRDLDYQWLLLDIFFILISYDVHLFAHKQSNKEEIQAVIEVTLCIMAIYTRFA